MNRIHIADTVWEETKSFYFEIKEPCWLLELERELREKIREKLRHKAGPVIIEYLEKHSNEFTRLQFDTNTLQEFGMEFSITRLTVIFYGPRERSYWYGE